MNALELWFDSGEDSLSVRRFEVHEGLSTLFTATVLARSPHEDLDLDALVGRPAALRLRGGLPDAGRVFRGVCAAVEQLQAEASGLSTYEVQIVPSLWLLTQRRNYRVFQHRSAPEIAAALLAEWGIAAQWQIDAAPYPRLEYRVQYGESDYAFLSRLLEEAGIAFTFPTDGDDAPLVFSDRLHAGEARQPPIACSEDPSLAAARPFVRRVRLAQRVRPGRLTIRDYDFRRSPDYQLFGAASAANSMETRFEHYHYLPGAFLAETGVIGDTPVADAPGAPRHDEKLGKARAERLLAAERGNRKVVSFETNVDLWPGDVFAIARHPRLDLSPDRKLLVIEQTLSGEHDGEWRRAAQALFAAEPFRPAPRTPKPRVVGVQSAVVVGPRNEEIHTDEFGRVRVQFPWDREGHFDERSSCWVRVSQGWAGSAHGLLAIPRVGQEVLVGFLEGDPDQPVVVGRVFNNASPVPYKLPEHKTRSTWKSASSPGAEGANELMFEDARGAELVYLQAERDLEQVVKNDEAIRVGRERTKTVGVSETAAIGVNQTVAVGVNRTTTVGVADTTVVGARHSVTVVPGPGSINGQPTGIEMVDDRLVLRSGQSTITLEGPNITLDAAAGILLRAAAEIVLDAQARITVNSAAELTLKSGAQLVVRAEDGDLVIQGGPVVRINPEDVKGQRRADRRHELPAPIPEGVDLDEDLAEAEAHAAFDPAAPAWFGAQTGPGGRWDPARWANGFGSFHFGLMGAAMGVPEGVLLRQAGKRARAEGRSKPEWGDPGNGAWGGKYPYGADPKEQALTRRGVSHYRRGNG